MNLLQELYQKKITPLHQTGGILIFLLLLSGIFLLLNVHGRNVWMILQAPVLFYTCMNIMVGVFNDNVRFYYPLSIFGFALIFSCSILLSKVISGESIRQHADFFNVLVLNAVFYLLFLMVSLLYKGIKHFLEEN